MTDDEDLPATVLPLDAADVTFDPGRKLLGMTEGEAVALAERWWDGKGRHLIRQPDFKNPDVGFKSGIARGLAWAQLTARERLQVVVAHWQGVLAPKLALFERGLSLGSPARGSSASPTIRLQRDGGGTSAPSPAGATPLPGATTRWGGRSS